MYSLLKDESFMDKVKTAKQTNKRPQYFLRMKAKRSPFAQYSVIRRIGSLNVTHARMFTETFFSMSN